MAIGSTVGNAIGGMFGGSSAPAEAAPVAAQETSHQTQADNCAGAATQFTKCMDDHSGNMQICNWYLEQLVRFIDHIPLPTYRARLGYRVANVFWFPRYRRLARLLLSRTKRSGRRKAGGDTGFS